MSTVDRGIISTSQQDVDDEKFGEGMERIFGKKCIKCRKGETECKCNVPRGTVEEKNGV